MPPSELLHLLEGPDRRSLGWTPTVVRRVLRDPALIAVLVRGLQVPDPLVRMRAADALEKVSRRLPARLARFAPALLRLTGISAQPEVQWHLAQILPRLSLSPADRRRARRLIGRYLRSDSSIVRTMALEAAFRLAPDTPSGRASARRQLETAARAGTPAMRARARLLLREAARAAGSNGRPRRRASP
jgi:HEAT repeat protein